MSGRRAKLRGLFWLLFVVAAAFGAAATFSDMVRMIPFGAERRMAATINLGMEEKACHRAESDRILKKLVGRLYPLEPSDADFQISVTAVHNPQINAFATLGGQVFVNQGLIDQAESPEELAGVLAHEIEHVRRRHVLENLIVRLGTYGALQLLLGDSSGAGVAQTVLGLQYGKNQEREADQGGLERLVRAEIDVKGFLGFFQRMQESSSKFDLLSDHPSDASRAARAEEYLGRKSRPVLDDAEWKALKHICRAG